MKIENNIDFWCDVSIVALESIMSRNGDVHSVQYENIKAATVHIIKHMKEVGVSKETLQKSVQKFLDTREKFKDSFFSQSAPHDIVPAILASMCAKNIDAIDVEDESFIELISEARIYLENY